VQAPGATADGMDGMGLKRVMPPSAGQFGMPQAKQARLDEQDNNTLVCLTRGNDSNDVVIRTLVGEFTAQGHNHGRPVYQKRQDLSVPGAIDVWLYYWDARDGPTFEGWWFGNKLGGTQVWSICRSSSMQAPRSGWQIPWDGPVRTTLELVPKSETQQGAGGAGEQGPERALQEASAKVDAAEDAVDKAKISAEALEAGGDLGDGAAGIALARTEAATAAAQAAIDAARAAISQQESLAHAYVPQIRNRVDGELGALRTRLLTLEGKLEPMKRARQDHEQRQNARRIVASAMAKLAAAEVDADHGEELAGGLTEDPGKLAATREALASAQRRASAALQEMQVDRAQVTGAEEVDSRHEALGQRLRKLSNAIKLAEERAACDGLIEEVGRHVQQVTQDLAKATAEDERLGVNVGGGGEEGTAPAPLNALQPLETLLTSALSTSSKARTLIATKLVEVRRMGPETQSLAGERLQESKVKLESMAEQLRALRAKLLKRRWAALLRDTEDRVVHAETVSSHMAEEAAKLQNGSDAGAGMGEPPTKVAEAELQASQAVEEARRFLIARRVEAKGKEGLVSTEASAQLTKLQARLGKAEASVAAVQRRFGLTEQRLEARRKADEVSVKVDALEAEAAKAAEAVESLLSAQAASTQEDNDGRFVTELQQADRAIAEAVATLAAAQASRKQHGSKGPGKGAFAELDPRIAQADQRIKEASQKLRSASHHPSMLRGMLRETEELAAEAECLVTDASGPWGIASQSPAEAERTIQAAQAAIDRSRSSIVSKRETIRGLPGHAMPPLNEKLRKVQMQIDAASRALKNLRPPSGWTPAPKHPGVAQGEVHQPQWGSKAGSAPPDASFSTWTMAPKAPPATQSDAGYQAWGKGQKAQSKEKGDANYQPPLSKSLPSSAPPQGLKADEHYQPPLSKASALSGPAAGVAKAKAAVIPPPKRTVVPPPSSASPWPLAASAPESANNREGNWEGGQTWEAQLWDKSEDKQWSASSWWEQDKRSW